MLFSYYGFRWTYYNSPAKFVEECFDWAQLKDRPTTYQLDAVEELFAHHKMALRGPRGLGKTAIAAWVTHFFALTRDSDPALDWKIQTTAGTGNQLRMYLWPEIRKWARFLKWDVIGRPAYVEGQELLQEGIHLSTGRAAAVSASEPELMEGAHAPSILYIYDEAKSIAGATFDACEGAFSAAGSDTNKEAYALAISTPGEKQGRFFAICNRQVGFDDWHTKRVTHQQAIEAKRMSSDWAERRRAQWGESSQLYQNHVLGEFATGTNDGVIPMAWLENAHDRWRALHRDGLLPTPRKWSDEERETNRRKQMEGKDVSPELLVTAIGTDCNYGGGDKATTAERVDLVITNISQILTHRDHMPTKVIAQAVMAIQRARGGVAIVDVVGVGGGTVDELRSLNSEQVPFSAGSKAERNGRPLTDVTKTLRFGCMRDAAWWNARELLDPANGYDTAIPPDELIPDVVRAESSLMAEMLAPKWRIVGETIRVESKDELKKADRLGRSTDWADAVVQAFALVLLSGYRQPGDLGIS